MKLTDFWVKKRNDFKKGKQGDTQKGKKEKDMKKKRPIKKEIHDVRRKTIKKKKVATKQKYR